MRQAWRRACKMTAKIAPGTWVLLKNKDIPQQIGGVDCGVFMLMCDFPNIRRWWALILLENFGVFSESAVTLQESLPCEEQATLSSSEAELPIIQHMKEAVKWLHSNSHLLRGLVEEPLLIRMNEDHKEKARNNLLEQSEASREPFLFHFVFRDDMELFLQECKDKMGLRVNASFDTF
ncbi:uncharacterized protein LOC127659006 isoform X2 [Xyrauchen texanus]|uniref:uncharacterized protein LOC127659006 isoform X2 n=1 Tax=Xyrauchen texanus TaxID=154827 RepID=UPI002241F487|nr:uncharacterized protein LOC127659006 isoform X2 [Xyrauchen texanus]